MRIIPIWTLLLMDIKVHHALLIVDNERGFAFDFWVGLEKNFMGRTRGIHILVLSYI